MRTVLLLIASNTFMTIAWYGHLKLPKAPLLATVLVSWLIAMPEYALQVPANRTGQESYHFTPTQLKVIQEVISLAVFAVFRMSSDHGSVGDRIGDGVRHTTGDMKDAAHDATH